MSAIVVCDNCGAETAFRLDVAVAVRAAGGVIRCEVCGPPPVDGKTHAVEGDGGIGEILGPCPSCKVPIGVGVSIYDPHDESLMHPLPYCTYFHETDPNVIAHALAPDRYRDPSIEPGAMPATLRETPSD